MIDQYLMIFAVANPDLDVRTTELVHSAFR